MPEPTLSDLPTAAPARRRAWRDPWLLVALLALALADALLIQRARRGGGDFV